MRAGGLPGAVKRLFCGGNSACQRFDVVCVMAKGKGVLMNCTNEEPSGRVASRSSPAISGVLRSGFQTASPCRMFQPGCERSAFGRGGSVRQPQRLARKRKPSIHEKRPAQREESFFDRATKPSLKKNLNIMANLFSKSDYCKRNVCKSAAKDNGGKNPFTFLPGIAISSGRSRLISAQCVLPIYD